MATIQATGGGAYPNTASLSAAQTGSATSTNIVDRGAFTGRPALLKITTAVGATPTCTYAIEGSADAANWYSVPFADSATPTTFGFATFTITTATTTLKLLQADQPWRYLRITYSTNTNVTNTADIWTF
jgi:hypothetical protein